jgi:hypothetical protein
LDIRKTLPRPGLQLKEWTADQLARETVPVIICSCCGRYWLQEVILDRLDGTPPRKTLRLWRGRYVLGEYRTLDELAVELDKRGILIWPETGCE